MAQFATFTITLGTASEQTCSVDYTTVNETAVAPTDFTAESGTLVFPPGTVSQPRRGEYIGR